MIKYDMPIELDEVGDKALELYAKKRQIPKETALSLMCQRGINGELYVLGWVDVAEKLIKKEKYD